MVTFFYLLLSTPCQETRCMHSISKQESLSYKIYMSTEQLPDKSNYFITLAI